MYDETRADLWERLRSINEGMNRARSLAGAQQWEDAQEMLRHQERACQQFALWLEGRLEGPVEPGEMTQRYCQALEELQGIVVELQESFNQRREELLGSLARLNQQERVTKEYGGSLSEPHGMGSPKNGAHKAEDTGGFRPDGFLRVWSPRRKALYS